MLLLNFGTRMAAVIRLAGLAVISWTMVHGNPAPGTSGRRLLITVLFAAAVVTWLWWTRWPIRERGLTPDLYVLAAAGGVLIGASPRSASAAFVFVAAVAAAVRVPLERALIVTAIGALAAAVSTIVYDRGALALLAYVLGFVAAALAGSNARQSVDRAEQAELLLAQTQRWYEEQLRTARLEGSARIAREIHDVLAHTLAGLTIQLEATSALLQNGADRTDVLKRVKRAHELAREGLTETRRAVGALRADAQPVTPAAAGIEALVSEYRSASNAKVTVTIDGRADRLTDEVGQTLVRVVQESLTNVRKHAPGAAVTIELDAGSAPARKLELIVANGPAPAGRTGHELLSRSGSGYGLQGMRERAGALGGTLEAGPAGEGGWRVRLGVPAATPAPSDRSPAVLAG
ncbi:MAG: histidine kinase [Solirubrobacteraceae bacterium]